MSICHLQFEIKCGKTVKIYCCPCRCDSLVIAKFSGETCHDEILKFINISEEQHIFSTMSTKTDCIMVSREHVALQLIILEDFNCTHDKIYFTMNANEKKKVACTKCLKKRNEKYYKHLSYVFLDEKNGSGKICLQLFFDQCLVTINLQEDLKIFYNRCMAVKDNQFWFYNEFHRNSCYAASYDCLFMVLKFKVYCQEGPSTHTILNSVYRHIHISHCLKKILATQMRK